jgi:ADP-ribose pyrophosphatase YjhB (NUDIX family)
VDKRVCPIQKKAAAKAFSALALGLPRPGLDCYSVIRLFPRPRIVMGSPNKLSAHDGIRPIAIFCCLRQGKLLVCEGYDPEKKRTFCRPPGGGLEFGEPSLAAVRREVHEELGLSTAEEKLLGVLENRFTYKGKPGHEMVFVYGGRFVEAKAYAREAWDGIEADGDVLKFRWVAMEDLKQGKPALMPEGLLELLG